MESLLWMFTFVLAVIFLVTGSIKVFRNDVTSSRLHWARVIPRGMIIFLGILEILGALGMFLPAFIPTYAYLTGALKGC